MSVRGDYCSFLIRGSHMTETFLVICRFMSHCFCFMSFFPLPFVLLYPPPRRLWTVSSQWWNHTLSRNQTSLTLVQVWESPGWVTPRFWLKWTGWIYWRTRFSARGPHRSSSWGPKGTEGPPALWNRFSTFCHSIWLKSSLAASFITPVSFFFFLILLPSVAQDWCCRYQSFSLWPSGCWICGQP